MRDIDYPSPGDFSLADPSQYPFWDYLYFIIYSPQGVADETEIVLSFCNSEEVDN